MEELIKKWTYDMEYHKKKIEQYSSECKYDKCVIHSNYYAQLSICIADLRLKLINKTT